ncbi:hypothetical protein DL98DRAFT_204591 [Cadophora sp. DSE1049]|nr:hypothetical protein DL98DRAFT_204591 [Cadophora sp. DSE1049]
MDLFHRPFRIESRTRMSREGDCNIDFFEMEKREVLSIFLSFFGYVFDQSPSSSHICFPLQILSHWYLPTVRRSGIEYCGIPHSSKQVSHRFFLFRFWIWSLLKVGSRYLTN